MGKEATSIRHNDGLRPKLAHDRLVNELSVQSDSEAGRYGSDQSQRPVRKRFISDHRNYGMRLKMIIFTWSGGV